ncbi:MAG: hypothetical protein LBL20_00165 [Treponema sp.]|jgi:hypothetical protein|nr:hypothetical protein [Treponema sp.]
MKTEIRETAAMRGVFRMRIYRRGTLIEYYEDHNLIVDGARAAMTRLIAGNGTGKNLNRIAFGTNGDMSVPGDTSITSPFTKSFDRVSYPASNQVEFAWSLATTEANGKAISEFGLLCVDGSLFARKNRGKPINKDSDIAIDGQWVIIF